MSRWLGGLEPRNVGVVDRREGVVEVLLDALLLNGAAKVPGCLVAWRCGLAVCQSCSAVSRWVVWLPVWLRPVAAACGEVLHSRGHCCLKHRRHGRGRSVSWTAGGGMSS